MATGVLALVLGGGLVWLALRLRQAALARVAARAAYLDRVAPLFERPLRALSPTGFARLSGQIGGVTIDLQAVPDSLTFRKLPALWLLVTVPEPLPLGQRLDLMARPRGVEPFSAFEMLPLQIGLPPGAPEDAALRSDGLPDPQDLAVLAAHLHLFDDPRLKELVMGPDGLRLVWLADEADRGQYLLFRANETGQTPLAPEDLRPLLAAVLGLRQTILTLPEDLRQCA